jgi:UDP-N-acetylmuramyl pentapeptide phosphotransferase/UDP-N-acetylglucosamine-1-phosphate transferase
MDSYERIQKVHTNITPRVGGVALFIGAIAGCYFSPPEFFGQLFWPLIISSIPVFFIGMVEDLTQKNWSHFSSFSVHVGRYVGIRTDFLFYF